MIVQNFDEILYNPSNVRYIGSEICSNYVNYIHFSPLCCCGWVDMHVDKDHQSSHIWRIAPMFWSSDAAFIHRDKGKLVLVKPTLDVVSFKRTAIHGLLPLDLAEEVVNKQSIRFKAYSHWRDQVEKNFSLPKLIWNWA